MNIVISTDKRTDKQGRHPVRLSVCFMRRRYNSTLGVNMSPEQVEALRADYSGEQYSKSDAHPRHKEFIKILRTFQDDLEWECKKVAKGEQELEDINFSALLNKAKEKPGRRSPASKRTPGDVWLEFLTAEKNRRDLAETTVSNLYGFLKKLKEYDPNITIAKLATLDGVTQYIEWCITQGLSNRSAKNQHAYLRWFLRWCFRKGYCGNDFERYKFDLKTAGKKESLVVFLTMDELTKVEKLDLEGTIGLARDIFLFQCYTGLRHSDVVALRKSDIKDGFMRLTIRKTGTFIENKLNRYAMRIVDKYIDTPGERLFPFLNMNSVELHLKTIGKAAGLTEQIRKVEYRQHEKREMVFQKYELLTTHVGRKTFVVNSLDMGLTATQVIEYTGHSSITAMEPYISISRKKKDEAMNVWDTHGSRNNEEEVIEGKIAELTEQLAKLRAQKQPPDKPSDEEHA